MKNVIEAFDHYLKERNLRFSATIVGGAALLVMGIVERATQDVDCLTPPIPEGIKKASRDFSKWYSRKGILLKEDWLNNGPETLMRDLPKGWDQRTILLYDGTNLKLHTLGRLDLLIAKLYAYCDRQQDLEDCVGLKPTLPELRECYHWLITLDLNPKWPEHVKKSLDLLARRLGYEFNI